LIPDPPLILVKTLSTCDARLSERRDAFPFSLLQAHERDLCV